MRTFDFAIIALMLCTATSSHADSGIFHATYTCEHGVTVPTVYATLETGENVAIIGVEGQQVGLVQVQGASGVKYAPANDVSGYIWWTKGDEASLYFRSGADGSNEATLLSDCISFQ